MLMRLWLDDAREAPDGWTWAQTYDKAVAALAVGTVEIISFDHDLGEKKTGYDVAKWIEQAAWEGRITRLGWDIHTANSPGRKNITLAMESAERAWARSVLMCHCGLPLHYTDDAVRRFVEKMIELHGEYVTVRIGARAWKVQRHFIALHGIKAAELPYLGFEEIRETNPH